MHRTFAPILIATLCALPSLSTACTVPDGTNRIRAEVLDGVNAERAKRQLPPLSTEQRLAKAAQDHACDNARVGKMTHTGSDGSDLSTRLRRVGYNYSQANENVAKGYSDSKAVIQGWMASSGHRRNILAAGTVDLGIGIALGKDGSPYWVLDMARAQN